MNIAEYLYYLGLSAKKYLALKNQKRLPHRVISIGNITLGGTGKTPAAIAVAEEAKKRGFLPVILTRGYKGNAQGPCFVTRGEKPLLTALQAGDEPLLMAERLSGVPIVKGTDRYEAGMYAIKEIEGLRAAKEVISKSPSPSPSPSRGEGPNTAPPLRGGDEGEGEIQAIDSPFSDHGSPLFILDDGFQHWKLYRDRDIVLIDSRNPFGSRKLFPAGRLREPLTALNRADVIMITKAEREDAGLIAEIRRYNRHAPIFFSEHRVAAVRSGTGDRKAPDWLQDRKVFCFCGLADPESFRKTVAGSGADVAGMKAYRDHHRYCQQDVADIVKESASSGAAWIITTEKDFVKLRNLDLPQNILIIEIAFIADQTFFESVFA
ncbi:MAG: tetraacyldisaccharide 4'-kinase [Nitrospirae bacterium]|nr:tetraacyldisaccharide 4'-kinase [Nitrospirota bacterium]